MKDEAGGRQISEFVGRVEFSGGAYWSYARTGNSKLLMSKKRTFFEKKKHETERRL